MSSIKPTFVVAFICIALAIDSTVAVERPCPIAFKCSTLEDVVWATDGISCFVFRNKCQFKSANCNRKNDNMEVLKLVPKCVCQKLCSNVCPAIYKPVCAEYNGVPRTFSNSCELANHICRTGETYNLSVDGECTVEH